MKNFVTFRIWMLILTIFIFLICHNTGWSEEWIQINLIAFKGSNKAARTFQEAVFETNHLYVEIARFIGSQILLQKRRLSLTRTWMIKQNGE